MFTAHVYCLMLNHQIIQNKFVVGNLLHQFKTKNYCSNFKRKCSTIQTLFKCIGKMINVWQTIDPILTDSIFLAKALSRIQVNQVKNNFVIYFRFKCNLHNNKSKTVDHFVMGLCTYRYISANISHLNNIYLSIPIYSNFCFSIYSMKYGRQFTEIACFIGVGLTELDLNNILS